MKKTIFLIICITSILSGCKTQKQQPESFVSLFTHSYHKRQFIDFINHIDRKGDPTLINPYRLKALDQISSFESDTIIYYEEIYMPEMIIGGLYYNCSIYESQENKYHSYKGEIDLYDIKTTVANSLSPNMNINYAILNKVPAYGYFKNIVEKIKRSKWDRLSTKGQRLYTPKRDILLVGIKVGGAYKIKSYEDLLVLPKIDIEVEPLKIDSL